MSAPTHTIDYQGRTVRIQERELSARCTDFYIEVEGSDDDEVLVALTYDDKTGVSFYECVECGSGCDHIEMVKRAIHGN